MKTSFLSSA